MFEILHSIRRRLGSGSRSRPTHVVPLGVSCRASYQARAFFESKAAYPFDWWLTPIDGLTRYLSDPDPDRVYGAGALDELVVDGHVASVVAPEFGFRLYHEFPREDVSLPVSAVAPNWGRHVAKLRAHHTRRLNRLLALDRPGNRILFVRDRLHIEGESDSDEAAELVAKLWDVLSNRWSRAEIELLVLNVPCDRRVPQRGVRWVDFEDVRGGPAVGWKGDSTQWARAFDSWREMSQAGFGTDTSHT